MDLEELRVRTGFNKLSEEATVWMEMGSIWSENSLEKVLNADREVSEGWAGPNPSPKNWQNDAIFTEMTLVMHNLVLERHHRELTCGIAALFS